MGEIKKITTSERSTSRICRLTEGLQRVVEGPRGCYLGRPPTISIHFDPAASQIAARKKKDKQKTFANGSNSGSSHISRVVNRPPSAKSDANSFVHRDFIAFATVRGLGGARHKARHQARRIYLSRTKHPRLACTTSHAISI
jgi:hypothetical protein